MSPDLWRGKGDWLAVGRLRLFIRTVGKGTPVFLMHAFPTSSYDYSRLVQLLSDHYQLILFDYPGYGFSDKPLRYKYSLFGYAECLSAVAAHFRIQHAFMIAHDIGDSVALIALMREQVKIEKLVLLNGSVVSIPFDDPIMRLSQKLLLHPTLGEWIGRLGLINKQVFKATTKKLFSYPLPQTELEAFWNIIKYNGGNRLYPRLMRYMLERWQHQYHWLDALKDHPAPLTLIWGQADPIATPAVADALLRYRPDAAYFPLKDVGHYPHWETPSVVANIIRDAFG
jgi:pimeloyl-ACP methyl ester carboxylesterase